MEMAHMARGFVVEGSAFDHVGLYHERVRAKPGAMTPTQVLLLDFGHDVKERTDLR
jgi:hypothetical protein